MIRLVVAAALAVAMVAAAAPAVEDAQATRTADTVEAFGDRLDRAGRSLAATSDSATSVDLAATRGVAFTYPGASWTTARPAFVAVGGRPGGSGNRSVLAYALPSSPTRLRALSLPVPVRTPTGPVVFRGRGRQTVSLALVAGADGDGPALVIGRGDAA
ncbi:DUF7311 family protein [Halobellus rubicundus]|uniref:DUF7311 domain-containing protein n=1 Tax=Halobellus rubicundus TaxID=2996466 RepID=A0ABD5MCW7_9EURY